MDFKGEKGTLYENRRISGASFNILGILKFNKDHPLGKPKFYLKKLVNGRVDGVPDQEVIQHLNIYGGNPCF